MISEHEWKGNVRELENVISRAVFLARGDEITETDLPLIRKLLTEVPPSKQCD